MTDEEQLLKTGDSGIDKSKATSIALDKKATGRDIVAAWIAQLGKIEEADEELVAAIEKHLNRIRKVDETEAEKKKAEAKNDKES